MEPDGEPTYDELMAYLEIPEEEMGDWEVNSYIGQSYTPAASTALATTPTTPTTTPATTYGTGAYGAAAYHYCRDIHDGGDEVFKKGKKTLTGARGKELNFIFPNLIIDLSGTLSTRVDDARKSVERNMNFVSNAPAKFDRLKKFVLPVYDGIDVASLPDIVRLQWTDMSIPPVGIEFWSELWKLIPNGITTFCCIGSHGRTGTALASMMLAADPKMSSGEAMKIVWKQHCADAIETEGQMRYLRELAASRPGGDGEDQCLDKKARKG